MFNTMIKLIPVVLLLIVISACTDQSAMTGTYKGAEKDAPGVQSQIVLKDNGEGTWETDIDLVQFRWKVRGSEIWLHTKTGGVILGTLTPDGFHLDLPNVGTFVFIKQSP
ncbi:hypothetical protein [Desulfonatronovibrio hydrogenovorans]|uniref:hypothetical protein n=1 Tax=Desulfonatronovibrio hydrogenovorans TaxID=53245 RepID=UPI00048DD46C|nr:hypothetical protein [Desulfonatronovibrio hydrogenovorans]